MDRRDHLARVGQRSRPLASGLRVAAPRTGPAQALGDLGVDVVRVDQGDLAIRYLMRPAGKSAPDLSISFATSLPRHPSLRRFQRESRGPQRVAPAGSNRRRSLRKRTQDRVAPGFLLNWLRAVFPPVPRSPGLFRPRRTLGLVPVLLRLETVGLLLVLTLLGAQPLVSAHSPRLRWWS